MPESGGLLPARDFATDARKPDEIRLETNLKSSLYGPRLESLRDNMFDSKPYFIAEISGNHRGSLSVARELVSAAAEAGADAVKLQTYTAESMTLAVQSDNFRVSEGHPLWGGRYLYELYEEAHTPRDWHAELFGLAHSLGLEAFSTPFDEDAVDFLSKLEVPAFKVASLEIIDHPLLKAIGATSKPVLLSTGTASLSEIAEAVEVLKISGSESVIPLVCTSAYPSSPNDANLLRLQTLRAAFGTEVGLSDHTLGIGVPIAAVALGATIIEKHLTLERKLGGPDSAFSLEPSEFRQMVDAGRDARVAIGRGEFQKIESEDESLRLRPSLWVTQNVEANEEVSPMNVASVRPAGGLSPKHWTNVQGKRFTQKLSAGTALSWNHLR